MKRYLEEYCTTIFAEHIRASQMMNHVHFRHSMIIPCMAGNYTLV